MSEPPRKLYQTAQQYADIQARCDVERAESEMIQVMSDAGVVSVVRSVYRQQGNAI